MINSYLKRMRNQGAATLAITITLFLVSTLVVLFAANYSVMQQKTAGNLTNTQKALHAAEAGMEFGISYFKENSTTIIGVPVSGFILNFVNSSVANVNLLDGSVFTITYSNPIANNYDLIKITVSGTSSDGSVTRTVSQLIQKGSILLNPGNTPLLTKGGVSMSGNANIINFQGTKGISSASGVGLSGNAFVLSFGGLSTSSFTAPNVEQNSSSLQNTSQSDLIASYFGNSSTSSLQAKSEHSYTNSSNTNYSNTLNGLQGTSIFINQTGGTATINGNTTIGSSSQPVLLVVNGGLSLSGNVRIYGFVFIIGTSGITSTSGNVEIHGAIASVDDINMSGNSEIRYSSTILNNLQNLSSMQYYAKVPGSWKDF